MDIRPKLIFLDGIRGLCALYVVLFHAQLFTGYGLSKEQYSSYIQPVNYILSFGHYSVPLFIVLSGFCLTIPVAYTLDKTINGGIKAYIIRRARRILPAYFIALFLSLLLIVTIPILQIPRGTAWDSKIPISLFAILSHIFLIHNFSLDWVNKINGPMWSVATEWQIYFCFPVLVSIWRSRGIILTVSTAIIVGTLPRILLPLSKNLSWLHPWYLGLFAMGMAASIIVFSPQMYLTNFRNRINWRLLNYTSFVVLIFILTFGQSLFKLSEMVYENVVGIVFSILLIHYALVEINGKKRSLIMSFINSKYIVFFGVFSYSIYLTHSPLLALLNLLFLQINMTSDIRLLMMIFLSVPISILCSYGFYLLFEKKRTFNYFTKNIPVKIPISNIAQNSSFSKIH